MESELLERLRKSWFPPAAVLGACSAFFAAAFRTRPEPVSSPGTARQRGPSTPLVHLAVTPEPATFPREYSLSSVIGGESAAHPFARSLKGIAVGFRDSILALGDEEVRVFDPGGNLIRKWRVGGDATCLAQGPDKRVYIGAGNRIEVYDSSGGLIGPRIELGEAGRPAGITAIKFFGNQMLIADAAAKLIRRFENGSQVAVIGSENKTGSFMLPNRHLDFGVDSNGVIRATDTGRHQVTSWALDGTPLGAFGKFGMSNPENFVGCCNPVNLALTPDGKVVTAEKMVARVKVYEPDGRLLAVIGGENFDPGCVHICLAVDSRGRIVAADPVRRVIRVYSQVVKTGVQPQAGSESA